MRLDYALRLNSVSRFVGEAWTPAQLFAQGQTGAYFSARRGLFADVAGTLPAQTAGQAVALMRDLSGNGNHAVQPNASQRPILGRHPVRGIVNIYPANTADIVGGAGWQSPRLARSVAPDTAVGEPAAVLTATEAHPSGAFARGGLITLAAGTYTFSAVVKGAGWVLLQPTVEANFNDSARAWFNLATGQIGTIALGSAPTVFTGPAATITPVGDGYRIALRFTVTGAAGVTMRVYLVDGNTGLPVSVGVSARIEAAQLEAGSQVTGYQRRLSQYDITEAGQRSLWYLAADGIDDWMQFAQPFTGGAAYTIAAVRDWQTGWPWPITFGSVSGASNVNFAQGVSVAANGNDNRLSFNAVTGWPTLPAGQNRVEIIRVLGAAQAQAWRNGTAHPAGPVIAGNILQIDGLSTLFRTSGSYGLGRFYEGILASGVLLDSNRIRLQRFLARSGGVNL